MKKVTSLKPKAESISGYVRALIEREHRARAHRAAAVAYQQFLDRHPDERASLDAWQSAPLVDDIEPGKP